MRIILTGIFAALFLLAGNPAFATDDYNSRIIIDHGKKQPLCQKIYRILKLPENKDYFTDIEYPEQRGPLTGLFKIPKSEKEIKTIVWAASSIDEFKNSLPDRYEHLEYYIKNFKPDEAITKIEKVDLDVYNRGITNTIYAVNTTERRRNHLEEKDPIRLGFTILFNDEASLSEPFYYKGKVFFADLSSNMYLTIIKFGAQREGVPPIDKLCRYHYAHKKIIGDQ